MSFENPGFSFSLNAGADLSADQHKFIKVDSNGDGVLVGAAEASVGVLQNDPLQGEPGTILNTGISKVLAGAAVAAGATVMSDASARAITATATNRVLGTALEAAAAADEKIAVLLTSQGDL